MPTTENTQTRFALFVFITLAAVDAYVSFFLIEGDFVVGISMFALLLAPAGLMTFYAWTSRPLSWLVRIFLPSASGCLALGYMLGAF